MGTPEKPGEGIFETLEENASPEMTGRKKINTAQYRQHYRSREISNNL